MKTVELLSVGLRLVGIYGILKGVQNIALAYASAPMYQAQFPDDNSYYIVAGGFVFAYFLVAFVLVLFPVKVARILTPRTAEPSTESALKGSDLHAAALTILGVYVVAYSLPLVAQNGAFIWQAYAMPNYYNDTAGREYIIYTISRSLELVIGLYLCLQAKALVILLHRLRGLGAK